MRKPEVTVVQKNLPEKILGKPLKGTRTKVEPIFIWVNQAILKNAIA